MNELAMEQETAAIANAILSLKDETSYLDKIVFPAIMSFLSAILGWFVASRTMHRQEKISAQLRNRDAANRWILAIQGAIEQLFAVKSNYHGRLNSNPYQRISAVPRILNPGNTISIDIVELAFVVPKASVEPGEWSQIARIRGLVDNYNLLMSQWARRNQLDERLKRQVLEDYSDKAYVTLSGEKFIESVGAAAASEFIDLTEQLIKSTDELVCEMNNFLTDFPSIAKSRINEKLIKEYGGVLTIGDNEHWCELLKPSPPPDFTILSELMGRPVEELEARYGIGY